MKNKILFTSLLVLLAVAIVFISVPENQIVSDEMGTGRTTTFVVAADDSPAHIKAQADYVCDDSENSTGHYYNDDYYINLAFSLCGNGGSVALANGHYYISNKIVIGNGTANNESTVHALSLIGAGMGISSTHSGTYIKWVGDDYDGAMIEVAGAIVSPCLRDFYLDCDSKVARGIDFIHTYMGDYERITIGGYKEWAYRLITHPTLAGVSYSASANTFMDVNGGSVGASTANGAQIGGDTNGGEGVGCSQNKFYGGILLRGTANNTKSYYIVIADNNAFFQVYGIDSDWSGLHGYALYFEESTNHPELPCSNSFYNCSFLSQNGVGGKSGATGNFFFPYMTGDNEPIPTDGRLRGVTDTGIMFGYTGLMDFNTPASDYRLKSISLPVILVNGVDETINSYPNSVFWILERAMAYYAFYQSRGGACTTIEGMDLSNMYSNVKNNAGTINIYYDNGYKIQNKTQYPIYLKILMLHVD